MRAEAALAASSRAAAIIILMNPVSPFMSVSVSGDAAELGAEAFVDAWADHLEEMGSGIRHFLATLTEAEREAETATRDLV